MTRRTVHLVERRSREVKLPRAEVDFLLAHARNLIDVVPGFQQGRFRLTPRGFVGFLDGPTVRYAIRPKVPWPNLLSMLGSAVCGVAQPHAAGTSDEEPARRGARTATPQTADLLAALAREFATRLNSIELVRGYREADTESAYLRGRLRTADQLRDAATRAFPDTFHTTETVFDLDTPWNRIPAAIGRELLRCPELPPDARRELAVALTPFDELPDSPITDADFDAATREARAAAYNSLLRLCRVIREGFQTGLPAFLLDLGHAFEDYVARSLTAAFADRPAWSVDVQPLLPLTPAIVLQPDMLLRRRGVVRVVLDAKWKRFAGHPEPDDLHQVLAYAAVTGANHAVLVYPGKRFGRRSFVVPGSGLRVTLFRLQVVGPLDECAASVRRMIRPLTASR